ncbi:hypothetical protein UPYG_G00267490 [Umbra pygmaea]|uniref:Uncharacterized protein n=1 Tax=Umbra pygmaea TaxID=75934 RepID=A0ABD0WSC8_UMBPY
MGAQQDTGQQAEEMENNSLLASFPLPSGYRGGRRRDLTRWTSRVWRSVHAILPKLGRRLDKVAFSESLW